jgi:hypothetical protein
MILFPCPYRKLHPNWREGRVEVGCFATTDSPWPLSNNPYGQKTETAEKAGS